MQPLTEKESSHLQISGAACLLGNMYKEAASKSSLQGFRLVKRLSKKGGNSLKLGKIIYIFGKKSVLK